MALFRVSNERAQFDAAGNEASDQYGAGIRFTQGGNARVTTGSATNYNQGIPMSATGQVAIVDATAGLPAGTIFHNGLPMSGDKVCVSRNATAVVSNGLPYDAAGAVAADINLDLNFIATNTLNSSVTFTRTGTNATYFNSAGVLTSAGADVPRFDYNPSTLAAQGLLIEEQRTNSIRNNTMQGAVAGTPGTLPTNWFTFTPVTGITREVVGVGTESGVTYIDIRLTGTPSAANTYGFYFEPNTGVAALTGQTWTGSVYLKLQAGSLTGISQIRFNASEYTSGGVYIKDTFGAALANPTSAGLATQRSSTAITLSGGATTAFIQNSLQLSLTGAAIDITLRIGLPQLEQGAFATSVIPTTTTALTRSTDVAFVNTLNPWFNSASGTLYAEILRQTTTGFPGRARFSDGTANNAIDLYYDAAANSSTFEIKSGGTPSVQIYGGGGALNTAVKAAAAWETNNAAVVYDGSVHGTDTSVVVPSGINQMRIANALTGYVRRITYYPRRLSNAELQAITA